MDHCEPGHCYSKPTDTDRKTEETDCSERQWITVNQDTATASPQTQTERQKRQTAVRDSGSLWTRTLLQQAHRQTERQKRQTAVRDSGSLWTRTLPEQAHRHRQKDRRGEGDQPQRKTVDHCEPRHTARASPETQTERQKRQTAVRDSGSLWTRTQQEQAQRHRQKDRTGERDKPQWRTVDHCEPGHCYSKPTDTDRKTEWGREINHSEGQWIIVNQDTTRASPETQTERQKRQTAVKDSGSLWTRTHCQSKPRDIDRKTERGREINHSEGQWITVNQDTATASPQTQTERQKRQTAVRDSGSLWTRTLLQQAHRHRQKDRRDRLQWETEDHCEPGHCQSKPTDTDRKTEETDCSERQWITVNQDTATASPQTQTERQKRQTAVRDRGSLWTRTLPEQAHRHRQKDRRDRLQWETMDHCEPGHCYSKPTDTDRKTEETDCSERQWITVNQDTARASPQTQTERQKRQTAVRDSGSLWTRTLLQQAHRHRQKDRRDRLQWETVDHCEPWHRARASPQTQTERQKGGRRSTTAKDSGSLWTKTHCQSKPRSTDRKNQHTVQQQAGDRQKGRREINGGERKCIFVNQCIVKQQACDTGRKAEMRQTAMKDNGSLWRWPYWTRTLCESRLWDTHRQTVMLTLLNQDAVLSRAGSEIQTDSGSLWCWPYWTRMLSESRFWHTDR